MLNLHDTSKKQKTKKQKNKQKKTVESQYSPLEGPFPCFVVLLNQHVLCNN
jgi:hypothetical protein